MPGERARVGWICSYTPEEIIYAAGYQPVRLLPRGENSDLTGSMLSSNLCPYVRQIALNLERGLYGELAGIVVANSCNAMLHLYNVLPSTLPSSKEIFVYLLDLPRKRTAAARRYFARRLQEMAGFLGRQNKKAFLTGLREAVRLYNETTALLAAASPAGQPVFPLLAPLEFYDLAVEAVTAPREDVNRDLSQTLSALSTGQKNNWHHCSGLLLAGAIPSREIIELIAASSPYHIFQENCMTARYFTGPGAALNGMDTEDEILAFLAAKYLDKPPCPRLMEQEDRLRQYRSLFDRLSIKGIVFHDIGFCDMHHYDSLLLASLAAERGIPFLKIKTEPGQQNLGPVKTRVEAFTEIIV